MAETSLPSLIQQMCQPEFYPHPVTEPIRLLQTHVSYVLLTGDYAYKVKKASELRFSGLFHPGEAPAISARKNCG